MHAVVKWLYLLALVVWVGEVVFFSFVAAPALFRTFPVVDAGRAVGRNPRHHRGRRPAAELDETRAKAQGLLRALGRTT